MFDNDKEKIGTTINGVMVHDIANMESYLKENPATIGILAVPRAHTPQIADLMVKCGIKGLLNFSYMDLKVPENVVVENVHLTDSLMTLSYQLRDLQK